MNVHVVIKRKFRMNQPDQLIPLLKELNDKAQAQPGYISTNTLQSAENPDDYLVISIWESDDDWNSWFYNPERKNIQDQIDSLIGERTFYELFHSIY
jgi:heme-degrading monooxygenase HmoA